MKIMRLLIAFSFIVVLLFASTVVNADEPKPSITRIPFRLTKWNNLSVPCTINENYALNLMFHTAINEVSIVTETLDKLTDVAMDQEANVTSWGGSSKTRVGKGIRMTFGSVSLEDVTVFESARSGHQTDGKFGPEQLGSRFIEIDFDRSLLLLHPALPQRTADWKPIELHVENGILFIDAGLRINNEVIEQRFCLHSGYSGFALLDDAFASKHEELANLEILEESKLTDSGGNIINTKKASVPSFSLGEFEFDRTPVSFFEGAIGRQRISVLGGDFLKRFNLLFDLENNSVYLKKSQYFGSDYF